MISDKRLETVIKNVFGIEPENMNADEKFDEMSIWDSMTFMRFIIEIEEKFNVSLTNQEILEMDCLKKTIEVLSLKETLIQGSNKKNVISD
jgi:acyl carrier protein